MNTLLQRCEPVMLGVRDTVVDQFDQAIHLLHHPLSDRSAHEVRKALKRIRAGLRLLREPLNDTAYRQLNRSVRDAGRLLTSIRDAKVLLGTLDDLRRRTDESHVTPLRRILLQERRTSRSRVTTTAIIGIKRRLRLAKHQLQALAESRLNCADTDAALKKAYKKAHSAFKVAARESDDEHLHEWRKQVKYHFTQLEFVEPLKPKRLTATIKRAHKLSDCLGSDHDLAVLRDKIGSLAVSGAVSSNVSDSAPRRSSDNATGPLLAELTRRRAKLQSRSYKIGKALYARKPKRGAQQVGRRAYARHRTR